MPVEVVIREINSELLGIRNVGCDLHGEIGIVLAGIHCIGIFVQDLGDLGSVFLTDAKHQALADFVRNGVPQQMRLVFSE